MKLNTGDYFIKGKWSSLSVMSTTLSDSGGVCVYVGGEKGRAGVAIKSKPAGRY